MQHEVSYVIVSYNTAALTLKCIGLVLEDLEGLAGEVILVDNASKDGTVRLVSERYPSVRIVANAENRGFGAGNNQGMSISTGRYIILLNSDAFVGVGFTRDFIHRMDLYPGVDIFGPRLVYENGARQQSCYRFPSPLRWCAEQSGLMSVLTWLGAQDDYRHWAHTETREVDWVIGACMGIRPDVFKRTAGFDESFFMYAEEADWQFRIRKAGGKVMFLAHPTLVHVGGGSTAFDQRATVNPQFFTSQEHYYEKHYGRSGLLTYRLATLLGSVVRYLMWSMWGWLRPSQLEALRSRSRFRLDLAARQLRALSGRSRGSAPASYGYG